MKVPACVWHMIKLVPKETGPRYQLDGIRFHASDGKQQAVFTDGRIMAVAEWEESEPADTFVPRSVLCCLSGYFHDECDCGDGETFSPCNAKIVVVDDRAAVDIGQDWSISFKNETKLRFPDYQDVLNSQTDTNPVTADYDPLFLSKLLALLSDMDCRRVTWTGKDKDSPLFFAGKTGDVSLRGCVMSLKSE